MAPEMVGVNVRTVAPPPWFEETEDHHLNVQLMPTSSNFISSSNEHWKSQKLNPKRVRAAWAEKRETELEMEQRGKAILCFDWLSNFGRVWQSGSRKESRKEFEKQKLKTKVGSNPELPIIKQPSVSKSM